MADVPAVKGLFSKALGLFVETDDPPTQPAAPSLQVKAKAIVQGPSIDSEMYATLQKVIENRKTPYTALLEASQRLATVIPDETQRLKAAFVTISGDRSLADITKAIDVHISDIEGQAIRFKQTSETQIKAKAGSKRKAIEAFTVEAADATSQIEHARVEIDRLTARTTEISTQVQLLTQEADAAEQEIKDVQARFEASVDALVDHLSATKQHLSSVLS